MQPQCIIKWHALSESMPGRGPPDGNRGRGSVPVPDKSRGDGDRRGMGTGERPRFRTNRGREVFGDGGASPPPGQIGDGRPVPVPDLSGDGNGDGDRGVRALVHAPFLLQDLLRQRAHFSSFGASRGHVPSFLAASLRFIGAKRPFALRRGHLRPSSAQLERITEMRSVGSESHPSLLLRPRNSSHVCIIT
jgi:hypothetical protein